MALNNTMTRDNLPERLANARVVLAAYRTMRHRRHVAWMKAPDSQVEVRYAELKQAKMQVDAAEATLRQLTALKDGAK